MCGICGKLNFDGDRPVPENLIRGMSEALKHRGPDENGLYLDRNVGFGHRRLKVIDLGTGRQPMSNEDGTVWIVLNGEVYNYRELRADLDGNGHRFRTQSDTEVILHLYEDEGADCVHKLRGMFAFALWDANRRRLVLARDRLGKKPLVYAVTRDALVFASEIQAILKDPDVERSIDISALHDYLTYQYVPSPATIFRGVRKLPPAHLLIWERGDLRIERYWRPSFADQKAMTEGDASAELLRLLQEATRLRLGSDVPVGAFLSGGIDSSAVVALMSRLTNRPVKTFSIGFPESPFNELHHARRVARLFRTEHHEFIVRPDALEALPILVRHFGEPFADPSAIPTYYLAKLTRAHVTVALNGDGGDENFAGYPHYLVARWAQGFGRLPEPIRKRIRSGLASLLAAAPAIPPSLVRFLRFARELAFAPVERYIRAMSRFSNEDKDALYTADFRKTVEGRDSMDFLRGIFARADGPDFIEAMLSVDLQSYLPEALLAKIDITTMANALEARSPFLDHRFVEFAAKIPGRLKMRGMTTKYVLKKALAGILPPDIIDRRKMGFGVPLKTWFRRDLRPFIQDVLLDSRTLGRGYFRKSAVEGLLKEHLAGRRDHSQRLWTLLNLELWHRELIDPAASSGGSSETLSS